MHIMSKQFEENIYPERQQTSSEETPLVSSPDLHFTQSLTQYGKEFSELYQETYFQSELASTTDSKYTEKLSSETQCPMSPLEFASPTPGPSGVSSTRIPFPISDLESVSSAQQTSTDSSYVPYAKQAIATSYSSSSHIPSDPYIFFTEDYNTLYGAANVTDVKASTSVSSLLTDPRRYSAVNDDSERSQLSLPLIQTTASTTRIATAATTTTTTTTKTKTTKVYKTSFENLQSFKSFERQRRGRRRGYRRGSSLRFLNRPSAVTGNEEENLEAFETRNIKEESQHAYVRITEQPRPKALRFRYICEGRSAGSIPGVESTPTRKTFPTIRVENSKGPALAVVSCVTVNPPHRPHPHNLVGKEGCEDGVCSIVIDNPMMECSFSNLGIQCVKKRDIETSLSKRADKMIDPFQTGFDHQKHPQTIDLNSIRLCFQVYLIERRTGERFPLQPVVSNPIYDKKATTDLIIYKLSACCCCVSGGKEIILLCDKIVKEDIKVRFFEDKDGYREWEAFGDFQPSDVHKQVAISFKTPKYKDLEVKQVVNVWIQLFRPSDKSASEPVPFEYYPVIKDCKYFEDKILHITQLSSKEVLTSDSPAESMQEASDEGEIMEKASTGAVPKPVKRMRTSSSQSSKGSRKKSKSPELYSNRRQTRLMASKRKETNLAACPEDKPSHRSFSFDQTYCPQLEDITGSRCEIENPRKLSSSTSLQYSLPSASSSSIMPTSVLPMGPTATLASSSEVITPESENEMRGLHYMDLSSTSMRKVKKEGNRSFERQVLTIDIPVSSKQNETREKSLSPNSESLKRLKQDIETLNKLSNL